MTDSRYKIIPINQNVQTDQEDDGEDDDELTDNIDDDTVTIVPANDSADLHFSSEFNDQINMQTPTAILMLILIYFTLSIGLTFYQQNLLEVHKTLTFVPPIARQFEAVRIIFFGISFFIIVEA